MMHIPSLIIGFVVGAIASAAAIGLSVYFSLKS